MITKIKKKCDERGISITTLESACGLGKNSIYRWDENMPSIDRVNKVAEFFGCTIDDLLREE